MRDDNNNLLQVPVATTGVFSVDDSAQQALTALMGEFMASCEQRGDQSLEDWLAAKLAAYTELWSNEAAAREEAAALMAGISAYQRNRAELEEHQARGLSSGNWMAEKVSAGASAHGVNQAGAYAARFDAAIERANEMSVRVITRQDGGINMCRNLDGFIAEHHHANSFNLDAAAKGSSYRAKVLEPSPGSCYEGNSMDVGIYDGNGNLVRRYQAKYGADADTSAQLFERGDYGGQRRLVPEGQDVPNSVDRIEIDGIGSKPMSKQEAKAAQDAAQQRGEARQYDWAQMDKGVFTRQLGKQVLLGTALSAVIHGGRVFGRRAWNWLQDRGNPPVSEDMKEFFASTLHSTAHASVYVATSGAMLVAARSGWLGAAFKQTPAGRIAVCAMLALENAKVLFKMGKGEINASEALDMMGETTATALISVACAAEGATLGAAVGAVLGPVGAAVGGLVGGIAGGIAGSSVGAAIYAGGKQVARTAARVVQSIATGVGNTATRMLSAAGNFLNAQW